MQMRYQQGAILKVGPSNKEAKESAWPASQESEPHKDHLTAYLW